MLIFGLDFDWSLKKKVSSAIPEWYSFSRGIWSEQQLIMNLCLEGFWLSLIYFDKVFFH